VLDKRADDLEKKEDLDPKFMGQAAVKVPKKLFRNYTKWKKFSDFEIIKGPTSETHFR
jgi:hypothetical protein